MPCWQAQLLSAYSIPQSEHTQSGHPAHSETSLAWRCCHPEQQNRPSEMWAPPLACQQLSSAAVQGSWSTCSQGAGWEYTRCLLGVAQRSPPLTPARAAFAHLRHESCVNAMVPIRCWKVLHTVRATPILAWSYYKPQWKVTKLWGELWDVCTPKWLSNS